MDKEARKKILLVDLCARLPYGITIYRYSDNQDIKINAGEVHDFAHFLEYSEGELFKPYLRPMSSMTEEEKKELKELCKEDLSDFAKFICDGHGLSRDGSYMFDKLRQLDFLNSHHLDYRGLIEEGLAIGAPEDMYKI